MGKGERRIFTDEFKQEAVRLTETSGRTIIEIADDLGVGRSSLTRWKKQYRQADLLAGPHEDVDKELARLRKENELLRQERDLLKNRRRAVARLCAVETPATLVCGGELPMAYWRHSTPLKNVAHGPMRA